MRLRVVSACMTDPTQMRQICAGKVLTGIKLFPGTLGGHGSRSVTAHLGSPKFMLQNGLFCSLN